MKSLRKCCLFFPLITLAAPHHAQAQWAVFDASNYVTAVKEFKQAQQLYTTANQTRDQIISAYNLAYQMSRMPQNLAQRYQSQFAQWTTLSSANAYGNTSAWMNALNIGNPASVSQAYSRAVVQVQSYPGSAMSSTDTDSQATIKNQYATSELAQGTTTNTLQTLGTIRSNSQAFSQRLTNLEADTYSNEPNQQTEMAVLGKINTAAVLQVHSQQDTNQILAAAVQQQLVTQKQQIDAENRAINQAIYFQQNFPTLAQKTNSGVGDSLHSISLSPR